MEIKEKQIRKFAKELSIKAEKHVSKHGCKGCIGAKLNELDFTLDFDGHELQALRATCGKFGVGFSLIFNLTASQIIHFPKETYIVIAEMLDKMRAL